VKRKKPRLRLAKAWTVEFDNGDHFAVVLDLNSGRDGVYTVLKWRVGKTASVIGRELPLVDVKKMLAELAAKKKGRRADGKFAATSDQLQRQVRRWKCMRDVMEWTCPECNEDVDRGGHRCKEPTCRTTVCCGCFDHERGLCRGDWCKASDTYDQSTCKPAKRLLADEEE